MLETLAIQGLHEDVERHFGNEGGCDEGMGTKKEGMKEETSNNKKIYYIGSIYPGAPAATIRIKCTLEPLLFLRAPSTLQD